jgi:hypothetical protein
MVSANEYSCAHGADSFWSLKNLAEMCDCVCVCVYIILTLPYSGYAVSLTQKAISMSSQLKAEYIYVKQFDRLIAP